eukprot:2399576-Rhodomonas_salina.4
MSQAPISLGSWTASSSVRLPSPWPVARKVHIVHGPDSSCSRGEYTPQLFSAFALRCPVLTWVALPAISEQDLHDRGGNRRLARQSSSHPCTCRRPHDVACDADIACYTHTMQSLAPTTKHMKSRALPHTLPRRALAQRVVPSYARVCCPCAAKRIVTPLCSQLGMSDTDSAFADIICARRFAVPEFMMASGGWSRGGQDCGCASGGGDGQVLPGRAAVGQDVTRGERAA